jgi:hypothetical protein
VSYLIDAPADVAAAGDGFLWRLVVERIDPLIKGGLADFVHLAYDQSSYEFRIDSYPLKKMGVQDLRLAGLVPPGLVNGRIERALAWLETNPEHLGKAQSPWGPDVRKAFKFVDRLPTGHVRFATFTAESLGPLWARRRRVGSVRPRQRR